MLTLKKLSATSTRRIHRAYKYKDIEQVLSYRIRRSINRSVGFLNLVIFARGVGGKTTKTSFLRSSLIPEQMELGIFADE